MFAQAWNAPETVFFHFGFRLFVPFAFAFALFCSSLIIMTVSFPGSRVVKALGSNTRGLWFESFPHQEIFSFFLFTFLIFLQIGSVLDSEPIYPSYIKTIWADFCLPIVFKARNFAHAFVSLMTWIRKSLIIFHQAVSEHVTSKVGHLWKFEEGSDLDNSFGRWRQMKALVSGYNFVMSHDHVTSPEVPE